MRVVSVNLGCKYSTRNIYCTKEEKNLFECVKNSSRKYNVLA